MSVPDAMLPAMPAKPTTLAELSPWLTERIDASLPSIRASVVSTGPELYPVTVLVSPDGRVEGKGATATQLPPERVRALWARISAERFDELPRFLKGGSSGPCGPMRVLEVRRRDGRKVVGLSGTDLQGLTPAERDVAQRVLRIWEALPVDVGGY